MGRGNPCVQCGACCAFFRVSFFWEEANPQNLNSVPEEMTEPVNDLLQCMKGTNQPNPRCIALDGEIGKRVTCKIYEQRSSVCRDFGLHEEAEGITVNGMDLIRCNEARKAWNLPPLSRSELRLLKKEPSIRTIRPDHHPHIKNNRFSRS